MVARRMTVQMQGTNDNPMIRLRQTPAPPPIFQHSPLNGAASPLAAKIQLRSVGRLPKSFHSGSKMWRIAICFVART
jgi:hypothetical protein